MSMAGSSRMEYAGSTPAVKLDFDSEHKLLSEILPHFTESP